MPKRSRSHQIETESIRRFEQTLPSRWVCRRKDSDYGVDLEVEIFDHQGEATGLIFLVQLKGTDDLAQEKQVSMQLDRLEYLSKLDCPSIIVRYFSVKNSFHWKWLSNVFAEMSEPKKKTVTLRFDDKDAWSNADSEAIVRTLKIYRTIRIASRRLPIGLKIDIRSSVNPHAFELNCAVVDITSSCQIVGTSDDPNECLPVTVHMDGEYLRAQVDVVASIAIRLDAFDRDNIAAQLSYVLAYFASGYEFTSQTQDLATFIQKRGYRCQSRQIAAILAARMTDHPNLACELASQNGLHERQDESYLIYINSLLSSILPFEERIAAVSRFYQDALDFHAPDAAERQAAIHYSFGNALRVSGAMSSAAKQYNLARRKYTDYFQRAYFLVEFGAALFFRKHYRMAATLYDRAYEADPKPQTALCAGDSHLFCGQFSEAHRCYRVATESQDIFESSEGTLKDMLTSWVDEFSNHHQIVRGWENTDLWLSVLEKSMEDGQHDHAIPACLMVCYSAEDSLPFWAQMISLSIDSKDNHLVLTTIACAVWTHGLAAYALFRDRLLELGGTSDALSEFDQIVDNFYAQRTSQTLRTVTTRYLREHHYDTVIEARD